MIPKGVSKNVFINCPFDDEYANLFKAIVFTVFDCGFNARCALEEDDGGVIRIEKIFSIISNCRFGIHDISRTEIDPVSHLPRFNMPLELGMFLGAKRFGKDHKSCLIVDREEYRFQQYISDISGQDIKSHNNDQRTIITCIRDWLNTASGRKTIPGGNLIWERFQQYESALPAMCAVVNLELAEVTFNDNCNFTAEWLKENG